MRENPLVSVIIPTFNRAKTIGESIHSVLRQTYSNFEIIIADDCSEDETESAVKEIGDSRIRYLKTEKRNGACGARNMGALAAKGEILAFLDSDDIWRPEKLRMQLKLWKTHNWGDYILYGAYVYEDRDETRYYPTEKTLTAGKPQNLFALLLDKNVVTTGTMMLKKRIFLDQKGFDPEYPRLQDWELNLRLARKYDHLFLNEKVLVQHYTEVSISSNVENWAYARGRMLREYWEYYSDTGAALRQAYKSLSALCCEETEYRSCSQIIYDELTEPVLLKKFESSRNIFGCIAETIREFEKEKQSLKSLVNMKQWKFPYPRIMRGSRVVIYGAGDVGTDYVEQIKQSGYCKLILWVDKNYLDNRNKGISAPDSILNVEYDFIVISVYRYEARQSILRYLDSINICRDKIVF